MSDESRHKEKQRGCPVIHTLFPVDQNGILDPLLLKSLGTESVEFLDTVRASVASSNAQGLTDFEFSCFVTFFDSRFPFRSKSDYLKVIKHFKLPVNQIPELSYHASINETADKASTSILRTIEKSVDPHSDVLKQLFQAITDDAFKAFQTSELVIAYDKYAILG